MKVHFITSRITPDNNIEMLRSVVGSIKRTGHTIADDWLEEAYARHQGPSHQTVNWQEIFKKNIATIAKADVVIAEATHDSFAVGYQVAAAIHQKKPVLLLRREGAEKEGFIAGVTDEWAKQEDYTDSTLDAVVKAFLDENDITTKDMRFNFFIDRQIYNYLRWAALKTGKTKAEVLRELVNREIENKEY